jgi:hypothetical protein
MSGAIPALPNTPSWRGAQLKHRDDFTFTFTHYIDVFQQVRNTAYKDASPYTLNTDSIDATKHAYNKPYKSFPAYF